MKNLAHNLRSQSHLLHVFVPMCVYLEKIASLESRVCNLMQFPAKKMTFINQRGTCTTQFHDASRNKLYRYIIHK